MYAKIVMKIIGYSILTCIFSENREKYLGYGESAAGIGLMVGPVLGGFLFEKTNYLATFCFFGGMLTVNALMCVFVLPTSLNRKLV